MSDQWASSVANMFAKSASSNVDNIADTKAALALLHDTRPIYEELCIERYGVRYVPKAFTSNP
jgi:hypothetical protein